MEVLILEEWLTSPYYLILKTKNLFLSDSDEFLLNLCKLDNINSPKPSL